MKRSVQSFQTLKTSVQSRNTSESFLSRIAIVGSAVNSTLVGADTTGSYAYKMGFGGGVLMDLGSKSIVAETGLLYRRIGTSITASGLDPKALNLNYLSLPISAKYYFNGQQKDSLYMKAGVMPSILLSFDLESGPYATGPLTQNNTVDVSGIAAVGGKIGLTNAADLILEAEYVRAFTGAFGDARIYNSSYGFTSGLAFKL